MTLPISHKQIGLNKHLTYPIQKLWNRVRIKPAYTPKHSNGHIPVFYDFLYLYSIKLIRYGVI